MTSLPTSRRALIVLSFSLIAFGVVARFLPHAWNFAPIAAIALAASAYVGVSYSLGIVLAVMVLSDISLGFYEWQIMLAVYGSFVVCALIGTFLRHKRTVLTVAAGSVASSLTFFTFTNFAVWLFSGMYAHTASGLLACFVAALPFYRNTFLGDLFFTGFLFILCEAVYRLFAKTRTEAVSALL